MLVARSALGLDLPCDASHATPSPCAGADNPMILALLKDSHEASVSGKTQYINPIGMLCGHGR